MGRGDYLALSRGRAMGRHYVMDGLTYDDTDPDAEVGAFLLTDGWMIHWRLEDFGANINQQTSYFMFDPSFLISVD